MPTGRPAFVALSLVATLAGGCARGSAGGGASTTTATSTTSTSTPPTTTIVLPGEGTAGAGDVVLTPLAELEWPTALAARPGTDDLYIAEQLGRVRVLRPSGTDARGATYRLDPAPVLDIADEINLAEPGGEAGLLGITFSPDGTRLYVSDAQHLTDGPRPRFRRRLAEYRIAGDAVVKASRRTLVELTKPKPQHNAGQVAFGPDGYLYAAFGDASPNGLNDLRKTGQDPTDLLGGIIRIDPLGPPAGHPYAVPPGNPFADGVGGAPEVWIYGARNPWRFSWDRATGDLWVADVGELHREEINFLAQGTDAGANLGWSNREGTLPFKGRPEPDDHHPPIYEYDHDTGGCAVIGGSVYRGVGIPKLRGVYVFSDFCDHRLRGLVQRAGRVTRQVDFTLDIEIDSTEWPLSFAEDGDGELYVLTSARVYRLDEDEQLTG